jgi:hypothetical protein
MNIMRGLTTGLVLLILYAGGVAIKFALSFGQLHPGYYTYGPVVVFVIFAAIGTFKDVFGEEERDG